jgi:hypothetical protein
VQFDHTENRRPFLLLIIQALLTVYDFPGEHWVHIRTMNPIESVFATVRLRHDKTKGSGTRTACLTMVFKLISSERGYPRRGLFAYATPPWVNRCRAAGHRDLPTFGEASNTRFGHSAP